MFNEVFQSRVKKKRKGHSVHAIPNFGLGLGTAYICLALWSMNRVLIHAQNTQTPIYTHTAWKPGIYHGNERYSVFNTPPMMLLHSSLFFSIHVKPMEAQHFHQFPERGQVEGCDRFTARLAASPSVLLTELQNETS